MIATPSQDRSLDRNLGENIMLVVGPEMAAHWVIYVFPERRASMLKESVSHRADTLPDIAGTA